jgi:hypothetical protein
VERTTILRWKYVDGVVDLYQRSEERTTVKRTEERLWFSRGRRCLLEFLWGDAGLFFKCIVERRLGIESGIEGDS